jgi:DNA-binding response OmpR family regulator/two-component sensor histidine kinase
MNATVLIVDDSLTVRMDLAEALETAGLRCLPCATAADARRALIEGRVDFVVLDVLLPDADGVDLLKEIRAAPHAAGAPVLMLSTEAEVKDRIRGLQTGADEYVGKPYDVSYVVSRARELLRERQAPAASRSATILVIDDSVTFRETLRGALDAAGYAVLTAASGEEGLRLAADHRPSAIVVDGVLPGIDGATVIRHLRLDAALRGIPCLLLTASEDHGAELRALDAGADAFVRKEDDVALVLARLAAVLRGAIPGGHGEPAASLLGPKKILAVDDSQTYLQELAATLRTDGYDVVLAHSGEDALEMLAVQPVDCILLDLLMPGLGGKNTCSRIKAAPIVRDIPLIMLTALEDREAMIEGLGSGADDYISKSSDFDVLKARVRAQLRRKQFEDENRRIREELLRKEVEATEARASKKIAEARAAMVGELEREIGERRRAEAEAAAANRAKSEFLSRMSHELRTPLNGIFGFAQLLQMEALPADQRECVDQILKAGRHLLGLIDEVLDISRIEAGHLRLSLEPVAVGETVRAALDLVRPAATNQGIALPADLMDDRYVLADRQRLQQVLLNLLSNAVKYNRSGGRVTVAVEEMPEEWLAVRVIDTGPGIAPDKLDRLFTPFERLGAEGTAVEGTGLGLALSKHLVEAMGGTLRVESRFGEGSTFVVALPSAEAPTAALDEAHARLSLGPEPSGGRLVVLAIEDNLSNLQLVERIFARRPETKVLSAPQGRLGLELAREHRPDLILLDLHLPDLPGEEVLERLRAEPLTRAIPVVVLSADATPGQIARLLASGARAYLTKPLDIRRLLEVVEDLTHPEARDPRA